jgi:hypothetical protein
MIFIRKLIIAYLNRNILERYYKKSPAIARDNYVQAAIVDLWLQRVSDACGRSKDLEFFWSFPGLDFGFSFGFGFIWFFVV